MRCVGIRPGIYTGRRLASSTLPLTTLGADTCSRIRKSLWIPHSGVALNPVKRGIQEPARSSLPLEETLKN